jgi:hypothetical protein
MLFSMIQFTINSKPFAYLDPGTGSVIIQVVIAALLGGGILLKTFWKKLFRKKSKPEIVPPELPVEGSQKDEHLG